MDAVKIMAKDLVRTRRYVKKFMLMRANIQAVSLKIQTLKSQNAMAQAMKVKMHIFIKKTFVWNKEKFHTLVPRYSFFDCDKFNKKARNYVLLKSPTPPYKLRLFMSISKIMGGYSQILHLLLFRV